MTEKEAMDRAGAATVETWRLVDVSSPDPYLNMAIEEAILRAVGAGKAPPTMRLWQNDNAVIIGYFQEALKEANMEACRARRTAVVRRVSGGGAVYHDGGNLNYAVFVPLGHPKVPDDVMASYRLYCQGLIEALALLGITAEFAPINDIVVGTRKVSGTAQARRYGGLLHHGTLMLNLDIETMACVLNVSKEYLQSKGVTDVRDRVATLGQLGHPISVAEAKALLAEGFARALGVRFAPAGLTPYELDLAQQLANDKYRTEEWNLIGPRERREDKGHLG